MPLFSLEGRALSVSPEAWTAPTATLAGDVVVEVGASVRYGAVVGAEALIGNGSTVQDGARIGAPATVRGPLSEGAAGWVDGNPAVHRELARRHAAGVEQVG